MANDTKTTNANVGTPLAASDPQKTKFSIIDLMMMIMVIGVICTILIPVQQSRKHQTFVLNSLQDMANIRAANEIYKANDEWGDYSWNLNELNVKVDQSIFVYALSDTAIVAETNKLAREPKSFYLDMKTGKYHVAEGSEDIIFKAWMP